MQAEFDSIFTISVHQFIDFQILVSFSSPKFDVTLAPLQIYKTLGYKWKYLLNTLVVQCTFAIDWKLLFHCEENIHQMSRILHTFLCHSIYLVISKILYIYHISSVP